MVANPADPGIRPLKLLFWAALLLPVLLFAYASWLNYRELDRAADERIRRTQDILQEHALKIFQTVDRTVAEVDEVLSGLTDAEIRADEARLHRRLAQPGNAVPQVESIWAFDAQGHPLVSGTVFPVPPGLDNSERDYFQAQAAADAGTFIGDVVTAKIGGMQFFVVSRRRSTPDGSFAGVIAVTVPPNSLREFYARVGHGTNHSLGLLRPDGAFLARSPSPDGATLRLSPTSGFMKAISAKPDEGAYTTLSEIDGVERRVAYRKLPGYPLYIQSGIATAAIWRDLAGLMASHLIFGLPAYILLVLLTTRSLARSRKYMAEVKRRETAEAKLKQVLRLEAVGQLTGGVAHDFNNLLMVVAGNAERLRRSMVEPKQQRALDMIELAVRRGEGLTRQLLTFSRRQTLAPTVVDLGAQIDSIGDILRSSLRGDITLAIRALRRARAKVDAAELELALLNLVINARDAMPAGGRISIEIGDTLPPEGERGSFVGITVRDTGTGIAPEILPRVFEPFFTTKEVGKGTGLGLSQVYGFARQAGGGVRIDTAPGRGTGITIVLPATSEPLSTAADAGDAGVVPSGGVILLVEDNADIAEVTRSNLESSGYAVELASDADGARTAIESGLSVDLVFTDIVMPGRMSGIDLARWLRTARPALPVVLTTGYSTAAHEATAEGMTILRKPYDLTSLQRTIAAALARGTVGDAAD